MKIIAFAGSNSTVSINKKLVTFVTTFFQEHEVEILDLNNFPLPIYKRELELENGVPKPAVDFSEKIDNCDLILLSTPEHNGNFPAVFKNLMDWISRIKGRKLFNGKPMFLMATSDGQRGGSSVLEIAIHRFPFDGAKILQSYSLPKFSENFSVENGVLDSDKLSELHEKIKLVKENFA